MQIKPEGDPINPERCPFCSPPAEEVILQGRLWYVKWDRHPVNPGHLLLIPFRHVVDLFEATAEERAELSEILTEAKELLDEQFHPDGYNAGVNCGEAAGQTVMHLHVHLIPRYRGDMKDPRGGVRGVIPGRQIYRSDRRSTPLSQSETKPSR